MRAARFLRVLLFGLIASQAPVFAQLTVALGICNAGKVEVDAYFARSGSVATAHIKPAECNVLAKTEGVMDAGLLGFGFPDEKGQWGAARRSDVAPVRRGVFDETGALPIILARSKQRPFTAKHAGANVTIPGLWATEDVGPACSSPVSAATYTSPLPGNAPRWQQIERDTANFKASINGDSTGLVCYSVHYNFTVIPYPDSREIATDTRCDPCNYMTPQERAQSDQKMDDGVAFIRGLPGFNSTPLGRVVANGAQGVLDSERQDRVRRAEIAKGPYAMTWNDLSSFIASAFDLRDKPPLMANRYIILRATVSRVVMPNPGAQFPSVHVYFKDAITKPIDRLPGDYFISQFVGTDQAFGVCTSDQSIFSDVFGQNFPTAMVGKTVELQGEVNRGACGTAAGIQVSLTRQFKEVKPGMVAAKGQTWVPTLQAVPSAAPVTAVPLAPPAMRREDSGGPAATRASAARASARSATPSRSESPAATPATASSPAPEPAVRASVTPARPAAVPAPAAVPVPAPQKDPRIANVIQYLKNKLQEAQILQILKSQSKPIPLTGADRAQLEDAGASEILIDAMINPASIPQTAAEQRTAQRRAEQQKEADRFAACQEQASREFPGNAAAQRTAVAACRQARQ